MENNVKETREEKGISQSEMCKILEITQPSLSNKEAGRRPFTVDELLKLEIVLNTSISELFKEKKKEMEKIIKGDK